jgi:hypothetical protein
MRVRHKIKKDTEIVKIFTKKAPHPFLKEKHIYTHKLKVILFPYSIEIVTPPSK